MWCGGFGSADWFHNNVENLTFDVGAQNPGAIALQFYSNDSGTVREKSQAQSVEACRRKKVAQVLT